MATTKEVLALAVEIADVMLRNGGEIYRIEDTVIHILKAYNAKSFDVYVLSNGIFASANEDQEDSCSMIRHVPLGSVHLGRIAALNQLSRELCAKECSLEEAVYLIKRDTRHFAKRQLTWFRRESQVTWINHEDYDNDKEKILKHIVEDAEKILL